MKSRDVRVAIVDDESTMRDTLHGYCMRYENDNAITMSIDTFDDGSTLLHNYRRGLYDVLFLDVEMPTVNGMDAARRIRRIDSNVSIMFITNMAQYAINGYEVSAIDYVLKPLSYYDFALKLTKALRSVHGHTEQVLALDTVDGMRTVAVDDIRYMEVFDHYLIFHTTHADYRVRGSMTTESERLEPYGFHRIHKSYSVNLRHITGMTASTVLCDGATLPIGRTYKKGLMQAYMAFLNGEGAGA